MTRYTTDNKIYAVQLNQKIVFHRWGLFSSAARVHSVDVLAPVLNNILYRRYMYREAGVFVRSGDDCAASPDRLVVRDGDDQSAAVLTVLCGTRNAETVMSTGQALSVQLVTDAARHRQGFAATFSFVDAASVTLRPDHDRRPTSTTTAVGSIGDAGELGGPSSLTSDAGQINVPGL